MSEGGPNANGEQAPDTRPVAGPSPLTRVHLTDGPDKASASEHADDTKASTLAISLSSDHEKKPSGSGGGGDSTNDEKSSATVNGRSQSRSTTTKPNKPSSMTSRKSSKRGFWKNLVHVLLPCVGNPLPSTLEDDDEATLPPRKLTGKKKAKETTTVTTEKTDVTTNTNKPTTATTTTNTNTNTNVTTTTPTTTATTTTTRRKTSGAKVPAATKDSTTPTAGPDADREKPAADANKHTHDPSSSSHHTAVHPQIETSTIIPPPHVVPANIETAFDDPDHMPPEVPITSHAAEAVTSAAVQAPGSTGDEPETSDAGSSLMDDESEMDAFEEDEADRLIRNGGAGIPVGLDGKPKPLLTGLLPAHKGRKCLVLDLDETLVHSSMKYVAQADYVVPVEIEDQWYNFYVLKRPGVDEFLREMGKIYEVVVFTASLSKYADPVLDHLDVHGVVTHRLFRESCYNHRGNYVKDLSQLGRPIRDTIILDNSPASYIFHPKNAAPVSSWFNDPHDRELMDLSPFLADLAHVDDVRGILDIYT